MKKLTRRSFTAAGILSALGLGVFTASGNLIGCVYGPPPEEYEPDQNEIETVYGPPEDLGWDEPVESEDEYDPDLNEIEDVYGPPPMDDDGEDDTDEDYDPEENIPVAVYGPPAG